MDPVLNATDGNGEYLHPHVFLAVDDDRPSDQEAYDTEIRDAIVDLVSSSWNAETTQTSLPTLNPYRSEIVHNCIRKMRLYFSNVESRIIVEAPTGNGNHRGHHPLFSLNILSRTTDLNPTMFTKVPSFNFLNSDNQFYREPLTAEMQTNGNRCLENFFIFNIDEDSKVYEQLPEESARRRYVLSKGLTFHEIIVLYYACSTRRSLVIANMNALEKTFCYIHPQDLKKIIDHMDGFIATNQLEFHRQLHENNFFDEYMRPFFHMMLDPVEQGNFDFIHPALNEEE